MYARSNAHSRRDKLVASSYRYDWKVSGAKCGHHSHSDMATNDPTDANYAALHQPAADCVCLRKRFTVAEVEHAAATQMAQAAGV